MLLSQNPRTFLLRNCDVILRRRGEIVYSIAAKSLKEEIGYFKSRWRLMRRCETCQGLTSNNYLFRVITSNDIF